MDLDRGYGEYFEKRDGSVLAVGKGNPEWNYSAPHGAGRIMSRTKAKNELASPPESVGIDVKDL